MSSSGWSAWRDFSLARRINSPTDQQCSAASEEGVLLIANVARQHLDDATSLAAELQRLSKHAAVAIVALPPGTDMAASPRRVAPNLLVAQTVNTLDATNLRPWADLLIYESDDMHPLKEQLVGWPRPVIVQRVGPGAASLAEAAELCRQWATELEQLPCVAGCVA
jgi:hypothetical protein